jgi:hypothetical protein
VLSGADQQPEASAVHSKLLAFCISLSLLACATQQKSVTASPVTTSKGLSDKMSADNKRPMTCSYEMPVGSHIPQKTCRYNDDMEAQRQETQDMFREHRAINTEPR